MNGFMAYLTWADEIGTTGLVWTILAGIHALLIAAIVLVINISCRRWLSAAQMSLLWGVVLVRLAMPVAPGSTLSLERAWSYLESRLQQPTAVEAAAHVASNPAPQETPLVDVGLADILETPIEEPHPDRLEQFFDFLAVAIPLAWLVISGGLLARTLFSHARFCRRLKQLEPATESGLLFTWQACSRQAGVRKQIPILVSDEVTQPAIVGLWCPRLILPADLQCLADAKLRMVMLHELAHVRRWDIAANWLLVLLRAVHWWNPVYWLAASRYLSLREQACDAFALQRLEPHALRDYSELLLSLAQRQSLHTTWRVMVPASMLSFASYSFRGRGVRNRLRALSSARREHGRGQAVVVIACSALLAIGGLTDAKQPGPPPKEVSDWLPPMVGRYEGELRRTIDGGPSIQRTYDVAQLLNRIAVEEDSQFEPTENLQSLLAYILRCAHAPYNELSQAEAVAALSFDGDKLTVTAPEPVQAEIARYLRTWEASGIGQISIETAIVTHPRDIASSIGVSWQYMEAFAAADANDGDQFPALAAEATPVVTARSVVDDYLPVAVARLDSAQMRKFAAARGSTIFAPKVTIFNGQRAELMEATQTPFVVGVQNVANAAGQPRIAVVEEGIRLKVRGVLSSDARQIYLDARVDLSRLDGVHTASAEVQGAPTTIEIPRVKRCRIDVASAMKNGEALLIACLPTYEKKQFLYILLCPRSIQVQ